ncbi:MAG: histidine kinase [Rhodothermaceae bacterium]|nr:histidine kinase [Rhodothermaceae bacterium]MXW33659.1 histidine kinase [Rhodothermaceae bacterium]MXZ18255.1 histidine kinase [Rhodothermaceae bacterium]MYC03717.1 histidine kinase [Rhodothermaceae bacterium]MYE61727.1 histidine kinase [Rhodothermaceae bacterium]
MTPAQQVPKGLLAYRVSWRLSLLVLVTLFLAALVGFRMPWWVVVSISVIIGLVTFVGIHWMVTQRMSALQSTLAGIGENDTTLPKKETALPRDELSYLINLAHDADQRVASQMQELERMENYRSEFLGNVSHELKTPIFAIRGFAETLLDGALDDERVRRSFVHKVLRNANRLGNLAEDLSSVARIEKGELSMDQQPFNLLELSREVLESLESMASDREIAVRLSMPDELPDVIADRNHISQVLSNLIDNGIKYGQAGGQVEVIARRLHEGSVKVSVVDDGVGVSPEYIPRLTERFFRVEPSRSSELGGTGLGLAIVKHILSAHGSQLMVESLPGSGSTFGFVLPTTEEMT